MECLGACVNAPMVMIFKDSYEDLTPIHLEHIIDRFEAGKGRDVAPGPQIDRIYSAPVGGPVALTEEITPVRFVANPPAEEPAVSVPPSNAAKPVTTADETNAALKTPATDKKAAAANVEVSGENADKAGAPVVATLDSPDRPAGGERPEKPDDLKMISGVGPKIEGILHELGIYTFAQVASWKKNERDWVDSYLKFKGRIDRDDWVKQAEALARGGEAEYIKVFGKKPR
ncbi:NADH-quinone oxidoreductase chain 2 [compost metagenome]